MSPPRDKYAHFIDHPRYGRRPNITGLNPSPFDRGVKLHWNATTHAEIVAQFEAVMGKRWPYGDLGAHCPRSKRIPNTAIAADLTRQTPATLPVSHYFDLQRTCRDCALEFIFFAEEQKHWYEELGFSLDSDCVRCVKCRKRQQGIARQRETYEELFHVSNKTPDEMLEMAEAGLSLIEAGVFSPKAIERFRSLLNAAAAVGDAPQQDRCDALRQRLRTAANE